MHIYYTTSQGGCPPSRDTGLLLAKRWAINSLVEFIIVSSYDGEEPAGFGESEAGGPSSITLSWRFLPACYRLHAISFTFPVSTLMWGDIWAELELEQTSMYVFKHCNISEMNESPVCFGEQQWPPIRPESQKGHMRDESVKDREPEPGQSLNVTGQKIGRKRPTMPSVRVAVVFHIYSSCTHQTPGITN